MRTALAILGGLAVGLGFLAVVLVLNTKDGLVGCTAATAAGWTIPLLAGLLVAGVAWLLLAEDDSDPQRGSPLAVRCSDCGHPVADEWRLCPYCGALNRADRDLGLGPPVEKSPL